MTATTLHIGYLGSGFMFLGLILIPFLAHRYLGLNEVLAFWIAYVLTRPLGASFADWMAVEPSRGGLGLGAGGTSLILLVLVLLAVYRLARTRMDVRPEDREGVVVPVPPAAEEANSARQPVLGEPDTGAAQA
jgi:uncharacterized membrane-anchored protein